GNSASPSPYVSPHGGLQRRAEPLCTSQLHTLVGGGRAFAFAPIAYGRGTGIHDAGSIPQFWRMRFCRRFVHRVSNNIWEARAAPSSVLKFDIAVLFNRHLLERFHRAFQQRDVVGISGLAVEAAARGLGACDAFLLL